MEEEDVESENDEAPAVYEVERVVGVRKTRKGKEYFVKWKGYESDENTWEPEENLTGSKSLIKKFEQEESEKQAKGKGGTAGKKKSGAAKSRSRAEDDDDETEEDVDSGGPRGFARGRKAEKIIGATEHKNELLFLIKWEGIKEADLVPASVANVKCPDVVINYYQSRLTWRNKQD